MEKDYASINKDAWNKKTAVHINSDFYDNESFLAGRNTLYDIELSMLGDVTGKSILHLQCHFGQDSISLARMGANVTAVDLSDEAIKKGREFAQQANVDVEFICCNVYDLQQHLDKQFDIVFTSYGVIGWLPDLNQWANIVSHYIKSKGRFVMAEFHPLVWIFDDDFEKVTYDYFNTETIEETLEGSYGDLNADIKYETISWNHPTSEVLNGLIESGVRINAFREYNYSPHNCFLNMTETEKNKFRIEKFGNRFPMVFAIEGTKE